MDKDAYIKQLEDRIIQLEKRIEELERLLGMNSRNSSKPPSSDPPGMSNEQPSHRRKKRGARNGHQPHLRELMPEKFVQKHIYLKPQACTCGSTDIEETDQEPLRHQVVDIPPIEPQVTEYVQHLFRCKDCGELIYQPLSDDVKRKHFGPGVLAIVAVLTGMLNISKRKALAMMNQVFSVPMSLGGLSNCEAQLVDALELPYNEVAQYLRVQQTAHADETGWPRGNRQKGWLWTLCCHTAAFFMVHAHRGQDAAQKLLGTFAGVLHCDRWSGYNCFDGMRQLCWAHLKRDFKALSERKGTLGQIGEELFQLAKHILSLRKRVRDGTLTLQTFQRRMEPLMKRTEELLAKGANCGQSLSGRCRRILNLKQHLWTFVQDARVEPTNNLAERIVRQGVLWRKGSFGTQSERGGHYVERILTVCSTCRLQGRSVIEYLRDACRCHLNDIAVPSLINPEGGLNNSA